MGITISRRKPMLCPNCRAECMADDAYCRHCGTDLTLPPKSIVPAHSNLPTILQNPQLPRVAAGAGALAVGFALHLLRRSLLARLPQSSRSPPTYLPAPAFQPAQHVF